MAHAHLQSLWYASNNDDVYHSTIGRENYPEFGLAPSLIDT